MNGYVIASVVFLVIIIVFFPVCRQIYFKRMMRDVNSLDFKAFEKDVDSFWCKMAFSAFERESLRLSMYEMTGNFAEGDKLVQMMENMRLNKKQKAELGERGFYLYLEQGRVKKARHMLELCKQNGSEKQAQNLEILYSVLLCKESKSIDILKEKVAALENDQNVGAKQAVGTFEYLIGLQYSYRKDWKQMREWLEKAQADLKDSPYLEDIHKLLEAHPA